MRILSIMILLGLSVMPDRFELVYSGSAYSDEFYPDHIGNIYFIDDHKLIKIQSRSGTTLEYGSLSYGTITSADVSDPFQVLLFYRGFNRVLFLNNELAPVRAEVDLSQLGVEQAVAVCSSGKGGIWVFSDREDRLIYFDQFLQRSQYSRMLNSITGKGVKPAYMIEADSRLYLHVHGEGILVFDRFASYLKTLAYSGPERFTVTGGKIIYFHDKQLMSLDVEDGATEIIILPEGVEPDFADYKRNYVYILSGNRIFSYRIQTEG